MLLWEGKGAQVAGGILSERPLSCVQDKPERRIGKLEAWAIRLALDGRGPSLGEERAGVSGEGKA